MDVKALGCDYFATSLHKGVGAPWGTGLLYVKKERIPALWPLFGAPADRGADIRKLELIGTAPVTQWATMNAALDVHDAIGIDRIAARYRHLFNHWTEQVAGVPRLKLYTPRSTDLSLGIGTVGVEGVAPRPLYSYLKDKRGISTWPIDYDGFQGVWVSPYLYSTPAELDRLVAVLKAVAAQGLPA